MEGLFGVVHPLDLIDFQLNKSLNLTQIWVSQENAWIKRAKKKKKKKN